MKQLDRARILAKEFVNDIETAIILEDIRYCIDEGKSWEQAAREFVDTNYYHALSILESTYTARMMLRKMYFDELAKLRPEINNYKYNKKRGKVLLKVGRTAFVVTNCSRTYSFDCVACGIRLMGDYVAERTGARIDKRYCHKCFDNLLLKLEGNA